MSKVIQILIRWLPIMHTSSLLLSFMLVCWRYRRTPSLPSWLSPHRDATGDRIMHFSWGSECKCAHCFSSGWALFLLWQYLQFFLFFLWFDCLFLEWQTSLVNNHVSPWDFFFPIRCHLIIAIFLFILYSYTYCIITLLSCSLYSFLNRFEDNGNFLIFCDNDDSQLSTGLHHLEIFVWFFQ